MDTKISTMIVQLTILTTLLCFVVTMPTDASQQQQTMNEEIVVTAYPDTQKRFVDLNYVSPEVSDLLQKSNMNIQQIREQQESLKNRNTPESENDLNVIYSSTDQSLTPTSRE